jgi:hypothetical protein
MSLKTTCTQLWTDWRETSRILKEPLQGDAWRTALLCCMMSPQAMSKATLAGSHNAVTVVGETSFSFQRKVEQIAQEAALDGIYIVR